VQPSEYTSDAADAPFPAATSGAMKYGVPTQRKRCSASSASSHAARPKSATLHRPARVSNRLAGLMSRWITPRECAWASASAASATSAQARSVSIGPLS
jgi:hypothetical protein